MVKKSAKHATVEEAQLPYPTDPEFATPLPGVPYSAARPRDYESLLLYLESCAIDSDGRISSERMNTADERILELWVSHEFVKVTRVAFVSIDRRGCREIWLSPAAIAAAHAIRSRKINEQQLRRQKEAD